MGFETFLKSYGYLAVLVGTFLEGETILVLGIFYRSVVLVWFIHFRRLRRLRSTVAPPSVSRSEM